MKRVTIFDVARKAGVSKSTVSRVLQGEETSVKPETRLKVLRAIQELGYQRNEIATSLRTHKSNMVLLVVPDISNPFWAEVAKGVQETLWAEGYTLVVANSDWNRTKERQMLQKAISNLFDGIIINPAYVSNAELKSLNIPVTIIGGFSEKYPDLDFVSSDSYWGTKKALEYLYKLGHRKIGFINGVYPNSSKSKRLKAYLDFLEEKGINKDDTLIITCLYGFDHGQEAMKKLISLGQRPTAVFAANDILAIGALQACHDLKIRVPEDISLVGMDDIYAAKATTPQLTTVSKPKYDEGCQAAQFLIERMRRNKEIQPRKLTFEPILIERRSAGVVS